MQNKVYNTHQDFKGERSVLVPVSMYSRNKLFKLMHLKESKWLGVNLNRFVLTFHDSRDPTNFNTKEEVPFCHITGMKADLTEADKQKYYLTVSTNEEDLKFKFNNSRDFHAVVDCMRHTLEDGRPIFTTDEGYDETVKRLQMMTLHEKSGSVSSDDIDEFNDKEEGKQYPADNHKVDEDHRLKTGDEMSFVDDTQTVNNTGHIEAKNIHIGMKKEQNKETAKFVKANLNNDTQKLKKNLKYDYQLHNNGTGAEKDIAKQNSNTDFTIAHHNMKADMKDAYNIRIARY